MRFLICICLGVTLCAALPKKREADLCEGLGPNGEVPNWMTVCDDGQTCIFSDWICDGDEDCLDGSDENHPQCVDDNYGESDLCELIDENGVVPYWMRVCEDQAKCIFEDWVCDGESDCFDGSDETECGEQGEEAIDLCEYQGTPGSNAWLHVCDSGNECILKDWLCDKEEDCKDGSDEKKKDCRKKWDKLTGGYRSG